MGEFIINFIVITIAVTKIMTIMSLSPPQEPPKDLIHHYTLNNSIPMEYFYVDDTINGGTTHYKYSSESLTKYVNHNMVIHEKIMRIVDGMEDTTNDTELSRLIPKDYWLYYTLYKNNYEYTNLSITGKNVAVIGSMQPWVEALCLYFNANHVTTFEYNDLTLNHPNLTAISNQNNYLGNLYQQRHKSNLYNSYVNKFDTIFAMKSLDHDGLGRYGDPLNPYADLNMISVLSDFLKPEVGILFLTVPIGPDIIVFNLHRRYGPIRLPLLVEASGLTVREKVFWVENRFTHDYYNNWRNTYEPVLILQKPVNYTTANTASFNSDNEL